MDWRCGSSSRAPALQPWVQTQVPPKKKKKKNPKHDISNRNPWPQIVQLQQRQKSLCIAKWQIWPLLRELNKTPACWRNGRKLVLKTRGISDFIICESLFWILDGLWNRVCGPLVIEPYFWEWCSCLWVCIVGLQRWLEIRDFAHGPFLL
jgi:hypothetical protein